MTSSTIIVNFFAVFIFAEAGLSAKIVKICTQRKFPTIRYYNSSSKSFLWPCTVMVCAINHPLSDIHLCLSSWDVTTYVQAESLMTQNQVRISFRAVTTESTKYRLLCCFVTALDLQFTQSCVYALHHIIYDIVTRIGVQNI